MERITHSLKVFWRSERLLKTHELRLNIRKVQLTAVASLVAVFGLLMLNVAIFFGLVPYWGQAGAALGIAGMDLLLAGVLIVWARKLKPASEVEMVKEVRDLAISDIEHEATRVTAEVQALRQEISDFVHHPINTLLPGVLAPLLAETVAGLKARRTEKTEGAEEAEKAED